MQKRILTGITTTGSPHLGNYVGAIRPAIAASLKPDTTSFYFLADYHALVKCDDPARIQQSTLEIAASWLACGLDPEKVYFYRQSDIPEIPELTWLLTCVTAKGLLNRAHAYKAANDANRAAGEDPDAGVNAGLYMYPVLMAADILVFNATHVPVGRDQIQHIEMARDIGQRFNHLYRGDYFTLPEAVVDDAVALLPGLDGRKMSKSYNNTIPLWLPEKDLRKAILGIVTNSLAPGEAKNPDDSHIFSIYQAFASADETSAMRRAFAEGIGWGDAKQKLFERINIELAPMRERYEALIADTEKLENVLQEGATKANKIGEPFLLKIRDAVGLRAVSNIHIDKKATKEHKKLRTDEGRSQSRFVGPYREEGQFKFRFESANRVALFVSKSYLSFEDAKTALDHLQHMSMDEIQLAPSSHVPGMLQDLVTTGGELVGGLILNDVSSDLALTRFINELSSSG